MKDKKELAKKLLHKSDSFPYLVVHMPYTCSVFVAKILRTARTPRDAIIFPRNSKNLINQMMNQGGKIKRLSAILNKLFRDHFDVFYKYNKTSLEFVEWLLN